MRVRVVLLAHESALPGIGVPKFALKVINVRSGVQPDDRILGGNGDAWFRPAPQPPE